jgi:hypothetical protein
MWKFNCIIIKLTWKEPRSVWCNSVHAYSFSISSCIDQRRFCIIFLWKRWKIYIQAMQLLFIRCSRKAAKFIFMHIFQINIHWMNWIWRELCIVNLCDVVDCGEWWFCVDKCGRLLSIGDLVEWKNIFHTFFFATINFPRNDMPINLKSIKKKRLCVGGERLRMKFLLEIYCGFGRRIREFWL